MEGSFVALSDGQSDLVEQEITVRPDGDRTNRWITGVTTATVTLYLPEGEPTVAAVVCPGGGYLGHSFDNEGCRLAEWLRDRGVAAGVLKYRTHVGQPLGDKPLKDAQAAVEFLRQKTGRRVGVVGFSAGGHLTAMVTNTRPEGFAEDKEWVAFHAMMYPVISMEDGVTHGHSRKLTLGDSPTPEAIARYSADRHVTARTPPAFLVHTADDPSVPVENSLRYFGACRAAGVDAELHVYPTGGHGYGMRQKQGTLNTWTAALEQWLAANGFI